jgi:hypothetical protein
VSVKLVVELVHTVAVPVILPATGSGFTVITFVALALPQIPTIVWDIVAVPAVTPITTPVDPTVAIPVAPELHTPPLPYASYKVMSPPWHTVERPDTVPANGFIVTTFVALPGPQRPGNV